MDPMTRVEKIVAKTDQDWPTAVANVYKIRKGETYQGSIAQGKGLGRATYRAAHVWVYGQETTA